MAEERRSKDSGRLEAMTGVGGYDGAGEPGRTAAVLLPSPRRLLLATASVRATLGGRERRSDGVAAVVEVLVGLVGLGVVVQVVAAAEARCRAHTTGRRSRTTGRLCRTPARWVG